MSSRAWTYLHSYDIECETIRRFGFAEEVIVGAAQETGADLVAMGAYGSGPASEVLLGSVTQHVIANWKRPLLLCH